MSGEKVSGDWEDSDRGGGNKASTRAGNPPKKKSPTYIAYIKNKKGRHPRDQKELERAQEYIKKNPNFGKVSEDKAFNFVRDKLKKKYGSGVLTTGEKPPAPTDAQKKEYKKQQEKIAKERAAEFKKDPSQGRYPPGFSNRGSD